MRSVLALSCFALACSAPSSRGKLAASASAIAAEGRASEPRAPRITLVAMEPKTVEAGGSATISFTLDTPASVTVELFDERGGSVRSLALGEQPAGRHLVPWDLRDDASALAGDGVYRYAIRALGASGESVYEPSRETGGEELLPHAFTFDQQRGELAWVMPRAGRARLRAGVVDFPHLVTLLDWTPLAAGRHVVRWDGLDGTGLVKVAEHPRRVILLSLYALPDNAVIVRGHGDRAPRLSGERRYPAEHEGRRPYMHAGHARERCHEIDFDVELPHSDVDARGRPIVTGSVPVTVRFASADARRLVDAKFEVAIYEDLEYVFEEEDALDPFTFLWDTTQLSPGDHLLTIDVIGYDDHLGVKTLPVVIGERP